MNPAGEGTSSTQRLVGVVISIPEPAASELKCWRASFGDPLADVVPAHITLVTTTPTDDWQGVVEHVRAVAAAQQPFIVSLQGSGTFQPVSPVVFVNVNAGFTKVGELHRRLQSGPLARELQFEFHPHVTVAHDVAPAAMERAQEALSSYSARFAAVSMGLYEHDDDGVWQLSEQLPFGGTSPAETGGHHLRDGER